LPRVSLDAGGETARNPEKLNAAARRFYTNVLNDKAA
jgi:hypothetical protein